MKTKPAASPVATLRNPWTREDHYARVLPALGQIIDITPRTPGIIQRQPPLPEERRVNRRSTPVRLIGHQVTRALTMEMREDQRRERVALEAANGALHHMSRTWWARVTRWLRGLVGGRG